MVLFWQGVKGDILKSGSDYCVGKLGVQPAIIITKKNTILKNSKLACTIAIIPSVGIFSIGRVEVEKSFFEALTIEEAMSISSECDIKELFLRKFRKADQQILRKNNKKVPLDEQLSKLSSSSDGSDADVDARTAWQDYVRFLRDAAKEKLTKYCERHDKYRNIHKDDIPEVVGLIFLSADNSLDLKSAQLINDFVYHKDSELSLPQKKSILLTYYQVCFLFLCIVV